MLTRVPPIIAWCNEAWNPIRIQESQDLSKNFQGGLFPSKREIAVREFILRLVDKETRALEESSELLWQQSVSTETNFL